MHTDKFSSFGGAPRSDCHGATFQPEAEQGEAARSLLLPLNPLLEGLEKELLGASLSWNPNMYP